MVAVVTDGDAGERLASLPEMFAVEPGLVGGTEHGHGPLMSSGPQRGFSHDHADPGAETQGRMMTFLRTAHQQGADAIAMLVDLARAPDPGIVAGLTLRPD